MAYYKFMGFASHVVLKAFGPAWSDNGQHLGMQEMLLTMLLKALQSTQGLVMWAASLVS